MPALPSTLLPILRRHRPLAALMLLILASTPILDGGCFTYNQVRTSRKECWSDLHAPCAAYAGGDGSLTLVLPDRGDLAKAKFYAVRFEAQEVKAAAQRMKARPGGPLTLEEAAEQNATSRHPPTLIFEPTRQTQRVCALPGATETQWEAAMAGTGPRGAWLHATNNAYGLDNQGPYNLFGNPKHLPAHWTFTDNDLMDAKQTRYIFQRQGGVHMVPTAEMWWVPATLVVDVVTSPIQLVVLVGVGVSAVVR